MSARSRAILLVAASLLLAACTPGGPDPDGTATIPTSTTASGSPAAGGIATATPTTGNERRPGVHLTFDELTYPPATAVEKIRNRRATDLSGVVITADGGAVMTSDGVSAPAGGADGGDVAVTFPAFDPSETAARAGITITDLAGADDLAPGKRRFTIGADFRLDPAPTSSREAGSHDNGDNLVQRGLANEPTQIKLQLDDRAPSCRMHAVAAGVTPGPDDEQVVTIDDPAFVPLDTSWYRVRCTRTAGKLTLTVLRLDAAGQVVARTTAVTKVSAKLDLTYANREVPFTVGAKIRSDGTRIMTDADQFNGAVDNVVFLIGKR